MKHPFMASLFTLIIPLTPILASAQSGYKGNMDNLSISEVLEIPSYKLNWEKKIEHLAEHPEMNPEIAEELLEYATSDRNYFFDSNERVTLADFAVISGSTNLELLEASKKIPQEVKQNIILSGISSSSNPEFMEAAFNYALTSSTPSLENSLEILSKLTELSHDFTASSKHFFSENSIDSLPWNKEGPLLLFLVKHSSDEQLNAHAFKYATNNYYKQNSKEIIKELSKSKFKASQSHFEAVLRIHCYTDCQIKEDALSLLLEQEIDPNTIMYLLKSGTKSDADINTVYRNAFIQAALTASARTKDSSYKEISWVPHLKELLSSHSLSQQKDLESTLKTIQALIYLGVDLKDLDLSTITQALIYHYAYISSSDPLSKEAEDIINAHAKNLIQHGSNCHYECDRIDLCKEQGEIIENELIYYAENPELILKKKHKNLSAPKTDKAKIPQIMHHIWLTNPDAPREMRAEDIEQVIRTKEIFTEGEEHWEHVVWVNDKTLVPQSIKILEAEGINVKSITTHAGELSNYHFIQEFIGEEKWGMASDTLRYSLIERFGGVYADLNFVFERNLNDEIYRYDFFTEDYETDGIAIDNFFFAAKANHPIVTRMTELVARNVGPNPPQYIKDLKDMECPAAYTTSATADPTYTAYIQKANEEGTIDVIYPKRRAVQPDSISIIDYYSRIDMIKRLFPELANACSELISLRGLKPYLWQNNLCPAEELYFGHDGTNGNTWMTFGNG